MNQENVAKLVAALRSGEYEQVSGCLRSKDSYCCLGVACDISGLGTWEEREAWAMGSSPEWNYVIRDDNGECVESNATVLPKSVAQWLGIQESGDFTLLINQDYDWRDEDDDRSGTGTGLTELNDEGFTFAQIADLLENGNVFEWKAAPMPDTDEDYDI